MLGLPASLLPLLLKSALGLYRKEARPILSHLSIYVQCSSSICAGGSNKVMDDITQQGFSRRYYHGAGISMEPLSPFSAHRFGLLPDPNLLKGPSDWRNRATVQALGINFAQTLVLHHPYSSLAAPPPPPSLLLF